MSAAIVTVVVLAAMAWVVLVFNRLVRDRNRVRTAWSDIDVQLKRRHDLVPPLVAVVKGYAGHERATLDEVTRLRSASEALQRPRDLGPVESALGQQVFRLVALAEAYPELKANASFARLHTDLVEVEDHIQFARRYYNGSVRALNTRIESFPDLLVARTLGFRPADFFELEDASQRAVPAVRLP